MAIIRTTHTAHLTLKPFTAVKVSMGEKPSTGTFKILSLTEGNRPASVDPTFPLQPVRLGESGQIVW